MAVFDSFMNTINKGVATVSVKSESLVENSRIKSAISANQKQLETAINALGAKVYQMWKSGQLNVELLTEDFERMKGIEGEIAALNARLEQVKAEESKILGSTAKPAPAAGTVFCTNCGKALAAGSRFCDECGTPVG